VLGAELSDGNATPVALTPRLGCSLQLGAPPMHSPIGTPNAPPMHPQCAPNRSLANETVTVDEAKAVYPFMAIGANVALVRVI